MYIDDVQIYIPWKPHMSLQIANPMVVAKVEQLARTTGLSKTAAVEKAVDALLREQRPSPQGGEWQRLRAILAQIDRVPDLPSPVDPFDWDEHGLPR
jgi:antitoxin VapB